MLLKKAKEKKILKKTVTITVDGNTYPELQNKNVFRLLGRYD